MDLNALDGPRLFTWLSAPSKVAGPCELIVHDALPLG